MSESYIESSGVILSRKILGENTNYLTLFLKNYGIMNATTPSRLYSGDREPFIWGTFKLKKKSRGKNYFIEDIDVRDDMLSLRKSKEQILTAIEWCDHITRYLERSQPDNDLLSNLYWNMKLLSEINVPCDTASWRFIWKWLELWGLAPEFKSFFAHSRFTDDEIMLLAFIANSDIKIVIEFFKLHSNMANIKGNFFRKAYHLSQKLLNEK